MEPSVNRSEGGVTTGRDGLLEEEFFGMSNTRGLEILGVLFEVGQHLLVADTRGVRNLLLAHPLFCGCQRLQDCPF